MTNPQQPTPPSPIFDALDEALGDDDTDDDSEDLQRDVICAIWYGFDSPEEIHAMIDDGAAALGPFDADKVRTTAARELAKKRRAEQGWPQTTDVDKLERAFARLHEQGVCALHCAGDTQEQGIEAVADVLTDDDTPEDRYHGYCFYYSQDVEGAIDNQGLPLAHGHVDRSEAEEAQHVAVARAICEALRQEGLEVDWNGSTKRRINLPSFRWQRRTPG